MQQYEDQTSKNVAIAMRVSTVSIVVNVALTAFKLIAGVFAHSGAMLSDAVHSASDIISTVVVMLGVKISGKASDEDHPYGHERMECVAAIGLSGLLFITGAGIGLSGIQKIAQSASGTAVEVPGVLALIAAVVSILVKEWMYWYTRRAAQRICSTSLMADAWHHRSDAISSIGSLLGVGGALLGFPVADPIAGVLIALLIVKVAYDIAKNAINQMLDHACPQEMQDELYQTAAGQEGVLAIDSLKTRQFGARSYVDIEIAVEPTLTIDQGHEIAHHVHKAIEDGFPSVKHCMVHVNPYHPAQRENGRYPDHE